MGRADRQPRGTDSHLKKKHPFDAAGQAVQRHLWGTDLSGTPQKAGGVGGLLGTWDNGATTRDGSEPGDGVARVWVCAYDGNGNVSAAIAATVSGGGGSGAGTGRVARYDYDAFGKTLATWGDGAVAEANRYRFSTKSEDGTGLLYYGYRFLQPKSGRWINRDIIGEMSGKNLSSPHKLKKNHTKYHQRFEIII